MPRIANSPVPVPNGVEVSINGQQVTIKSPKGSLESILHDSVRVEQEDAQLKVFSREDSKSANALAGTFRSILNNMVIGVSDGFERKLQINGVGYRAQVQGKKLNLTLGYSHPVDFEIPEGITIETPSQTEIIVRGIDKQRVGQVAADIRAFRKPEPYKGKGVKYADEYIARKEAKKA